MRYAADRIAALAPYASVEKRSESDACGAALPPLTASLRSLPLRVSKTE
jgi:hypothetical protein